ncbi:MAG: hypothetical protein A2086_08000 [Spirochaetes bacterium GWD1_27_9]|nr:MAG: hypothetical protein A2Z98_07130 [Spirochaetes bacterium GWB1_27_13]OHD25158.1 MAG: hypothetical protein A2Y34_16860 [Spirochaetes bacterium GWC1_27_15]OHD34464.1 MAG: hypothetical protein A2086_08000 [Spirochaetes bacterium GWD1_27_9]
MNKQVKISTLIDISKIAFRNIFRNIRRSGFCVSAIGVAVFFIIIMICYINGMLSSLENIIQTFDTGHILISTSEYDRLKDFHPLQYPLEYKNGGIDSLINQIKTIKGVDTSLSRITTNATLTNNIVKHAIVWGINIEEENKVNKFNLTNKTDGLIIGRFPQKENDEKYKNECIIGIELAKKLNIIKEVIEKEEFDKLLTELNENDSSFLKESYVFNKELEVYNLNIGKIRSFVFDKRKFAQSLEKSKKIQENNEKVDKKQKKLLEVFITKTDVKIPMKIISSQYSDKFYIPKVVGVFDFDFATPNSLYIILPFERLQRLASLQNKTQALFVFIKDRENTNEIIKEIRKIVEKSNPSEPVTIKDWKSHQFVVLLKTAQLIYGIIYSVFIIVASFLIVNTIIMIIHERIKEIGMMGALGMTRFEIVLTFFLEAVFLSIIGASFGTIIGGVSAYLLSLVPIDFVSLSGGIDFPISNTIFFSFSPIYLIQGFIFGVIVSGVCTIFPSIKSAYIDPVEALRN